MNRDQMWEQICGVWSAEAESVAQLKKIVEPDAAISVVEAIASCVRNKGRILTAGAGTSGAAARKIAHTLCCIEIPSFFISPDDSVHGGLGVLQGDDVIIAISKGGNTSEITKIIPAIKAKGAKLIGVTENEESTLARESDIILKVKVEKEPDPFNMLATASTMAVIAAFDAIAITLMKYTGYKREQFAVIHPGGAVGERLTKGEK